MLLDLKETEKLTELCYSEIIDLYLTQQFPEPILDGSGQYLWFMDTIGDWLERSCHLDNLSPELQEWWRSYLKWQMDCYTEIINQIENETTDYF